MPVDLSALADLTKGTKKKSDQWSPLTADRLIGHKQTLICFDPSLRSTGMVVLRRRAGEVPQIHSSQTLRISQGTGASGFESDYRQAYLLEEAVRTALDQFAWDARGWIIEWGETFVVHEMPPVHAPKGTRPTSSLMAGQAIRSAAASKRITYVSRMATIYGSKIAMVNAQQAKRLVCGNPNADKPEVHEVLRETVLPELVGHQQVTNEHERDALMVGLVMMAAVTR